MEKTHTGTSPGGASVNGPFSTSLAGALDLVNQIDMKILSLDFVEKNFLHDSMFWFKTFKWKTVLN